MTVRADYERWPALVKNLDEFLNYFYIFPSIYDMFPAKI